MHSLSRTGFRFKSHPQNNEFPAGMVLDALINASAHGLDDAAIADALRAALAFQRAGSWRCPICFHWQRSVHLTVAGGKVQYHSVCPRCARRFPTAAALRAAMRPYVEALE